MHPDEVTWITDEIAITNFVSAHDPAVLAAHGVRAVLCLDRDLAGDPAARRGVECVRLVHLTDGDNPTAAFREAVAALAELVASHERVVVHCRAGRSRSVAVVAAYLTRAQRLTADAALAEVRTLRESAVAVELIRLVEGFVG